ncbi:MAG: hypothetical protein K5930_01365 [Treponemataceae bacterium]|nr:hypothetical protein [Treponemataceae bacterium]
MKRRFFLGIMAVLTTFAIVCVSGCTSDGSASGASKEPPLISLTVKPDEELHEISDLLYGIFIEDINFAADGGLYGEMVANRSFEFTRLAKDDGFYGYSTVGKAKYSVISDGKGLNQNNPSYLNVINDSSSPAGVANRGFLDGMCVKEGEDYRFSVYARGKDGYTGPMHVAIKKGNKELASGDIKAISGEWQKYELVLHSASYADKGVTLELTIDKGSADFDMISLFPKDTYKGRENGMRRDLAEKLEELHPAFLRFPGGCVVEGINLQKAYDWKDSIGVDENRKPLLFNGTYGDVACRRMGQNIWTDETASQDPHPSFMSYGLGFYEYFQLAEDIGAIGVPVINCGICCMIQGNGSGVRAGNDKMQRYIDDALDLVEFCRGDKDTVWGAARIAMGHEAPFQLKYIGIGNEQWGDHFFKNYEAFVNAFAEARAERPELFEGVELMFSAGPDDGDSGSGTYKAAYAEAARWLSENEGQDISLYAGAIDHHYYNAPSWFLAHNDYYDEENYSRSTENMTDTLYGGGMQVFLGEYAAQSNTLEAALAEASYMTGLERNGDIIRMAAYAPLFGNTTATHWAPDLIWFNNHTVTPSVNYYVQKIFADNAGSRLLASEMSGAELTAKDISGAVGLGTWNTAASFDNIKVTDNLTGKVLAECDFSKDKDLDEWNRVSDGNWSIKDGQLLQSSSRTNTGSFGTTGTAAYFGDTDWTNYTYELDAVKTSGSEGFLIPFAVGDKDNHYFWNIGGWNNTVSCLQQVSAGGKSDQMAGTVKRCAIKRNTSYHLKVVVEGNRIKCYIDDQLYVDYKVHFGTTARMYQVVSSDESGDIIIKLVNVTGDNLQVNLDLGTSEVKDSATLHLVAGDSSRNDNILGKEEVVTLKTSVLTGIAQNFTYTAPKYSVSVIRVERK